VSLTNWASSGVGWCADELDGACLDAEGNRQADGVYFYVLTLKGTFGDVVTTKVQKFALLR